MDNRGKERKYISTVAPRRSAMSGAIVYPLNLPIVSFLGKKAPEILEELLPKLLQSSRSSTEGLDYNGCYNALPMIPIRADDLIHSY